MKVRLIDLAKVLGYSSAAITLAVKRDKLNKAVGNMIDLDDLKNRAWITKRLIKQGCEIPQDINFLFLATPITENEKSNSKINGNNEPVPPPIRAPEASPAPPQAADVAPESTNENALGAMSEAELRELQRHVSKTQRTLEQARADKAVADASSAQTKAANLRRSLIEVNPLARLLFGIVSAQRTQVNNLLPNLAQNMLDEIKNALAEEKPTSEILMMIRELWNKDLSKIYKAIDKELKYRIRKAKKQEITTEDFESAA